MPAGNVVYFNVGEEEKNSAVFKRSAGKREWGVKKNNGAHTERLVPYLLPCLEQAMPRPPRCVFFPLPHPSASPPPLLPPLQCCLPRRTAGSSRISGAALLHSAPITDYSLLPLLLDLKFGEVKGRHFSSLVFCEQRDTRWAALCVAHRVPQTTSVLT